jgi:type IV secretory pathway VirB2 component (pilin)
MNDKQIKNLTQWAPVLVIGGVITISLLFPEAAHATTAGGGGLPWETPLQKIVDSFLGPIAVGMCLIGFVAGVWRFMTGGEIDGFVRSMVVMALSGSILIAARPFINSLFGVGAVLGQ